MFQKHAQAKIDDSIHRMMGVVKGFGLNVWLRHKMQKFAEQAA